MDYILSDENNKKKTEFESKIEEYNKKYLKLSEEIRGIRESKEGTLQKRNLKILELQIQQEEILSDIAVQESAIAKLYTIEMEENLTQRRKNNEISPQEFSNGIQNIKSYRMMISTKGSIEDYDMKSTILEMKIKLETMKRNMGIVPKEEADKNITEMEQKLSVNEENRQYEVDELAKENFEYKRRNLNYQWICGQITDEEYNQELETLQQSKGNPQTNKEFEEISTDLSEEHLSQSQQSKKYEREVSRRSSDSMSFDIERRGRQNIDKAHEESVYYNVSDIDNKYYEYGMEGASSYEDFGRKFGEEYARGETGEKAELARQFGMLETKGKYGTFEFSYPGGEIDKNPRLLLKVEKVDGLQIEELENLDLDTSVLHQDIYVATYEIEEWDSTLNKKVYKPIKEYYQQGKDGELEPIGFGTEEFSRFTIEGLELQVENDQIIQGTTIEQVNQKEMADRLVKNGIEDSLQIGEVSQVIEITDHEFIGDFAKQCGREEFELFGKTYIVATINEKGEEAFNIVVRDDSENQYDYLDGIEPTGTEGREMYTTTGRMNEGGLQELEQAEMLREFVTKSGHRYSITRNAEGKLGFSEIFRENENMIQGRHVDTSALTSTYRNADIRKGELGKARETLARTKDERTMPKDKEKGTNPEGR